MVCHVDDGRCESSALVGLCAARAPRGALSCARCGERYEAGHAAVTACAMTGQFGDRRLVHARVPIAGVCLQRLLICSRRGHGAARCLALAVASAMRLVMLP